MINDCGHDVPRWRGLGVDLTKRLPKLKLSLNQVNLKNKIFASRCRDLKQIWSLVVLR
jgi:hypothetical protein